MKHAIRKHALDFAAVIALFLVASGIAVYILNEQRLRFPLVEETPFRVKAVLDDAQAVTAGQGQSVRVAGVRIGEIGEVELEDGLAVVTLDVERRFRRLLRRDSTALLRAKTGLKDMFIEVDPGHGPPLPDGGRIPASRTAPDVDLDEVLAVADSDTRDYLKLLIAGAGKGVAGRGPDLAAALRRLGPLHRDLARVNRATARRRRALRRLINRYGLLTETVGSADRDVVRLVRASRTVFRSLASEEQGLSQSVAELPGSLRTTREALDRLGVLGRHLPGAVEALRPPVRELEPAAAALLPLVREATPIVRDQLRPLARRAPAEVEDLGVAAARLARAGPDVTKSLTKVNRLLNILAHNPGGREQATGDFERDRAREEGYLHWLAWTANAGVSVFGTADGQGVFRRFTFINTDCGVFVSIGVPQPVADLLGQAGLCSGGGT
jgi:phospholipid/cholesterol/gamma-HCH transport system substrate-binding protein